MRKIAVLIIVAYMAVFAIERMAASYTHEQAHQNINTYFGYESEIVMGFSRSYVNITPGQDYRFDPDMWTLHAQNDIVRYNTSPIIDSIWAVGAMFLVLLATATGKEKDGRHE